MGQQVQQLGTSREQKQKRKGFSRKQRLIATIIVALIVALAIATAHGEEQFTTLGSISLTVPSGYTTMDLFLVVANQLAGYFFARNEVEMNSTTTPDQAVAPYVAPYTAIGISTVTYTVSERRQIRVNLQTIEDAIHAAMGVVSINLPVKLIALPEGALTGFPDEIFNIPHVTAARDIFIDIPGEETEYLGRLARHYETYIIMQCKARWPEIIADRYFNTLAVINPEGQVVHKAAKNHIWCREHSTVPHDVYSRWVEVFGDGIEAFYPVLRTPDIGVIGTICCSDGEYPEAVRALAFNGAEVVYRPSEAMPMTGSGYPGGGGWLIQNQGHAQFNGVYMLCPNVGPVYAHPQMKHPMDVGGGNSHIVDYLGNVIAYSPSGNNTFVAAPIYIDALRQFRTMNLNTNWLKDMRMELFRRMYERPIHPKDLALHQPPGSHAEVDEIYRANIERLIAYGTYTPPAYRAPGPKYYPTAPTPEEEWESVHGLWDGWPPEG